MDVAGRSLRFRVLHAVAFGVALTLLDVLNTGWPPSDWTVLTAGPLFFLLSLVADVVWQWYLDT